MAFLECHSMISPATLPKSINKVFKRCRIHKKKKEIRRKNRERMEKSEKGNGVTAASRSPMASMGSSRYENEEVNTSMRTAETILRLVPMALGVAALVVMLKNSQSNEFGSVSYSDLGAFRY